MTLKGGTRGARFSQVDLHTCARTVWSRTTNFGMVTHVGAACFRGSTTSPIPTDRGLSAPRICPYLHPHGLTYSYQIWHGNICGEGWGCISRGSGSGLSQGGGPIPQFLGTSDMRPGRLKDIL